MEGKKGSSSAPTVLSEFEAIENPEDASAFYRQKREEIHNAYGEQINNQNIK
jgi:hypothetical protein